MAITTISGINSALPGQILRHHKTGFSPSTSPAWCQTSTWTLVGLPGTGVAPSSGLGGDVPTDATTGAYAFTNPASGNSYLGRITAKKASSGLKTDIVSVYDRLWHNSGIDVTSTSGQTINSVALDRPDANGARVEAFLEVYTALGAGTPTVTLAYTDQDGNVETTGTSGVLIAGMGVGRTCAFSLATGDTGVRSIQTWTASATFTSGTMGLVMRRCVTSFVMDHVKRTQVDAIALGLPRVYDNACLEILWGPGVQTMVNGTVVTMQLIQG